MRYRMRNGCGEAYSDTLRNDEQTDELILINSIKVFYMVK